MVASFSSWHICLGHPSGCAVMRSSRGPPDDCVSRIHSFLALSSVLALLLPGDTLSLVLRRFAGGSAGRCTCATVGALGNDMENPNSAVIVRTLCDSQYTAIEMFTSTYTNPAPLCRIRCRSILPSTPDQSGTTQCLQNQLTFHRRALRHISYKIYWMRQSRLIFCFWNAPISKCLFSDDAVC